MKIDRIKFYREFKEAFYPEGGLQQRTVDALNFILSRIEKDGLTFYGNIESVAYCLGTWIHESRRYYRIAVKGKLKNVPIEFEAIQEKRASPTRQPKLYKSQERYWKTGHMGRGIVQVTWDYNYFKIGEYPGIKGLRVKQGNREFIITGAALKENPSLMLDPELSYRAAAYGMRDGLYRPPNKLSKFFVKGKAPKYVAARDIVNAGLDKAHEIANNAVKFERVLRASVISVAKHPDSLKLPVFNPVPITQTMIEDAGEPTNYIAEHIAENIAPPVTYEEEADLALTEDFSPESYPDYVEAEDEDKETPTGAVTSEKPPEVNVIPTRLKGWITALSGFVITTLTSITGWIGGLPPIVLASLIFAGGLATAALIVGVIFLKNQREQRAANKEIELIKSQRAGGETSL